jgi:DNA polymerase III epsilon subunit-like protein
MKYLFFDCECANCYNHEGKICSFGYVITDESFKIIEEQDLIINPDAPFDPHVLGVGYNSIDLAYTPVRFKYAPKFDERYSSIMGLFVDPETTVFGYAVENDIGFLSSECRRYHKELLHFAYYDIQDIYRIYREWDRSPSLEDALKDLDVPFDDYAEHQSSDDAKMSMLLLKRMARDTGLSPKELIANYPTCADNTSLFQIQEKVFQRPSRDLGLPYDSEYRDKSRTFNELIHYIDDSVEDHHLQGCRFLFSNLTKQDMTTSLALANHIIDGSGEVVRYLKEATHYVVYDEQERTEVADLFAPINIVVVLPKEIDNIGK